MLETLRALWRPAVYHGFGRRDRFFEGWYFKSVSRSGDAVYAVIPGVSLTGDGRAHAFIQVLDGLRCESRYHRFPLALFSAARDRFELTIGPNRFSLSGLTLAIEDPDMPVSGELRFDGIHPWPVRRLAPGAMGWYAFVPRMECYHGILSFSHRLAGSLSIAGRPVDFAGGRGYIEKDWGRSFPRAWVWAQTNHFSEPDACISLSVADVPWLGSSFTGHIAGLWLRGRLYRFATYTGARLDGLDVSDAGVRLAFEDRRHRIEIACRRTGGAPLASPRDGAMTGRIVEAMTSEVDVALYSKTATGPRPVYRDTGVHAGLEVAGDPRLLRPGASPRPPRG